MADLELRYPARAATVEELKQHVGECPGWAVKKFAVEYEGRTLDYDAAVAEVRKHEPR